MENDVLEINDNNIYNVLSDEIDRYTELYINSLVNPEEIYNTFTFQGLLNYIKSNVFRVSFDRDYKRHSVIDYNNIKHLYISWELYKSICSKYNKPYTILGYCTMLGLSRDDISIWEKSKDNNIISFIQHVKTDTENILVSNTIEKNSIGSIFLLKSKYSYSETPQTVIIDTAAAHNKPDNIADKYGSLPELPEKPV